MVEIGFVVILLGGTWILPNTIEAMVKRYLSITGPRSDQVTVLIFTGIMLSALLVMLYVGVRRARRLMRTELVARGHTLCIPCGYDLQAHGDADRCPECGARRTVS
jgi:hypothetical protein